jgi:molecular chaperone HscB
LIALQKGLSASDFEIFSLPERFELDATDLEARWKALQKEVHPDRFAAEGPAAQRVAMQWSVRVNEAHQRLRNPLRRAAYLCERWGVPVAAESNTAMPASFLMQQMAWREELENATSATALELLADTVQSSRNQQLAELADLLQAPPESSHPPLEQVQRAAQAVRALMFVERFVADVNQRLDALDA